MPKKPTTASQLKAYFIRESLPLLEDIFKISRGEKALDPKKKESLYICPSGEIRRWILDITKEIIVKADSPVSMVWDTEELQDKVDEVLAKVASGELSPNAGKSVIELLTLSLEGTELKALTEKLADLES